MSTHPNHTPILELLPAYALDALEPEEKRQVERHLPTCEICQAELHVYLSISDHLPLAAPDADPGPALKRELISRIQPPAASRTASPTLRERLQRAFAAPRLGWAALLLVLAVVTGGLLFRQAAAPAQHTQYTLVGTDAAPEATGLILVDESGQATLQVNGLPPLEPDRQYQLWLIDANGQRISGAIFSVDQNGHTRVTIDSPRPIQEFSAFGITIEPWGGSQAPTGERVLGFNL